MYVHFHTLKHIHTHTHTYLHGAKCSAKQTSWSKFSKISYTVILHKNFSSTPTFEIVRVAVWYSSLQHVAVCCGVWQWVAMCCSLRMSTYQYYFPALHIILLQPCCSILQRVVVCCSVLQCVVVCCSVWHRVAVGCSVLQFETVCVSVSLPSPA